MENTKFTETEIKAAKAVRDEIIKGGLRDLQSIYMAGEIVMWDEMQQKESNALKQVEKPE